MSYKLNLSFFEEVTVDEGRPVGMVYMDISKAFDENKLIKGKVIKKIRYTRSMVTWLIGFRTSLSP